MILFIPPAILAAFAEATAAATAALPPAVAALPPAVAAAPALAPAVAGAAAPTIAAASVPAAVSPAKIAPLAFGASAAEAPAAPGEGAVFVGTGPGPAGVPAPTPAPPAGESGLSEGLRTARLANALLQPQEQQAPQAQQRRRAPKVPIPASLGPIGGTLLPAATGQGARDVLLRLIMSLGKGRGVVGG